MVKLSLVNLISHYWLSVFPYIELIRSIANIRASPSPLRKLWSFPDRRVVPKFLSKKGQLSGPLWGSPRLLDMQSSALTITQQRNRGVNRSNLSLTIGSLSWVVSMIRQYTQLSQCLSSSRRSNGFQWTVLKGNMAKCKDLHVVDWHLIQEEENIPSFLTFPKSG